jgi:cytochrome P450 family 4
MFFCNFRGSSIVSERFQHFLFIFNFIFKFSEVFQRDQKQRKASLKFLFEAFKESSKPELQCFVKNEFMSRILLLTDRMEKEQIRDHIYSVIGAGYETSGNATAHCILFLAMHPEIQEKAYDEILRVLPFDDSVIEMKTFLDLPYLDRVFKESLRVAAAVPTIGREALVDFELFPGHYVRKGTIFCVDIKSLHRRKDLWGQDAHDFNPDRFLPENFAGKENFFIPFSAGKRNCLGYRYASVSFKIVILKLLKNFKFSTSLKFDEIIFTRQIALKLVGPHLVSIEKRIRN